MRVLASLPVTSTENEDCTYNGPLGDDLPLNCVSWAQAKAYAIGLVVVCPLKPNGNMLQRAQGWNADFHGAMLMRRVIMQFWVPAARLAVVKVDLMCRVVEQLALPSKAFAIWRAISLNGSKTTIIQITMVHPTDGSAWVDTPRSSYRVLRGGAYFFISDMLTTTYRLQVTETTLPHYGGFREWYSISETQHPSQYTHLMDLPA